MGCAITISNQSFNLVETLLDLSQYFTTLSVKPVRSKDFGIDISTSNWKNEYWKLVEYIIEEASHNNIDLLLKLLNGDDYFGKFIYRTFLNQRTVNRCDALISRFCVDTDGIIYGCPALSEAKGCSELNNIRSNLEANIKTCKDCEVFFYCGGECMVEYKLNNCNNLKMCEFKKMLIYYAMYLKVYFINYKFDLYLKVYSFCQKKSLRFKKNIELYLYLERHKELSFVEGKNQYYISGE